MPTSVPGVDRVGSRRRTTWGERREKGRLWTVAGWDSDWLAPRASD
jgi:hypothetical protein